MKESSKIFVVLLLCMLACVSLVSATTVIPVLWTNGPTDLANHVIRGGNPDCTDIGCTDDSYVINPPTPGTYDIGNGHSITLVVHSQSNIDWSSDELIHCVIVKGGDAAYVYEYPQGATHDEGLSPPANQGGNYGFSHIWFCGIVPNNQGLPAPEFPTMALPFGMIIGIVGLVYLIKTRD
jgi:hypothetical protein